MSPVTPTTPDSSIAAVQRRTSPWLMLILATIGFAVNFWAWSLLSPLGPVFRDSGQMGQLTESQVSLLVAVPVIVGSLGRIPVGALTDAYGGRIMFVIISLATIVPVLVIGFFELHSYVGMLIGGFFLGIAGTTFAVGVPFVNGWFPPAKRGLAVGVFGAGMGGTAVSALTTVDLYQGIDDQAPFVIASIGLAIFAVVAWVWLRNPPAQQPPSGSFTSRLKTNALLPITWQACVLYAVAFGGYVAFSVYLPAYLKTTYDLPVGDAAMRMAGFVAVAVVLRPVGGWLADRLGAINVLVAVFAIVAVGAGVAALEPVLEPAGAVAFLTMAAALGAGSGATFALIARATDPARVGGVTGLVGAAGGLGGFVPPLIMGYIYGRTASYSLGLWLLAITAVLTLVLTVTVVRRTAARAAGAE